MYERMATAVLSCLVTVSAMHFFSGTSVPYESISVRIGILKQDLDKNGIVERYTLSLDSSDLCEQLDMNQDGHPDSWSYSDGIKEIVFVRDLNFDGDPDWWGLRVGDDRMIMAKDLDFDGTVDVESETEWRMTHEDP